MSWGTNSPGEGVASEQADPAVGVGSQVLPITSKDWVKVWRIWWIGRWGTGH